MIIKDNRENITSFINFSFILAMGEFAPSNIICMLDFEYDETYFLKGCWLFEKPLKPFLRFAFFNILTTELPVMSI